MKGLPFVRTWISSNSYWVIVKKAPLSCMFLPGILFLMAGFIPVWLFYVVWKVAFRCSGMRDRADSPSATGAEKFWSKEIVKLG